MKSLCSAIIVVLRFSPLTAAVPILNPVTGHHYNRIDAVKNWFDANTMQSK